MNLPITHGDTVMVFSDLFSLLRKGRTVEGIFTALMDAVGEEGTLIIPAFDWLPSALGNYAKGRDDAVMTSGKYYTFAVFGKKTQSPWFAELLGEYQMFRLLHDWGGKLLVMGLPFGKGMPFYHYVETTRLLNYRHWIETPNLYVRNEGVLTDTAPMDKLLWDDGQWEGSLDCRSIPARTVYRYTQRVINEGRAEGMLWKS